ncbi:MAG: glycoside hydrolase family 99-like domain-containing protein [Prevotella sp.]|nr:glycoside hydrolase family 99-like domain-containing protein [Prevotella sp.]MBR6190886.1 glycoside hydrolase family 99-like domain-containing protein [Prevotella sp.]
MKARVIALYLPQFHPIPENDKWWGKGFTEWTNVGKARPLFRGHYQPRVPADLGYYDLRMPEVREAQAEMAREAGIEGFCYWHYWFGNGRQLLERPFNEVLASGKPDFPFCLGWANHEWTNKTWEVGTKRVCEQVLMPMVYSKEEHIRHFNAVLPAFRDKRYITVDGKPLFLVFRPLDIPEPKAFIDLWQQMARENGLPGIHFVGIQYNMLETDKNLKNVLLKNAPDRAAELYRQVLDVGFDAVNSRGYHRADYKCLSAYQIIKRGIWVRLTGRYALNTCRQSDINKHLYVKEDKWENVYPTLLPNWDRSARSGRRARIYTDSTPEVFGKQIEQVMELVKDKPLEHRIAFLMSWNEWAEGNYVEPDLRYGHGYLDELKKHMV